MTLQELAISCAKAINQKLVPGFENSKPGVTIRMPPKRYEAEKRRLVPKGKCPMGIVLSRGEEYDVVAFDAVELLAWCVANSGGKIKVRMEENEAKV